MTQRCRFPALLIMAGLSVCGLANAAAVTVVTDTAFQLEVTVGAFNLTDSVSLGPWFDPPDKVTNWQLFLSSSWNEMAGTGIVQLNGNSHLVAPHAGEASSGWPGMFSIAAPVGMGNITTGSVSVPHPLLDNSPGPHSDTWTLTATRATQTTMHVTIQASHLGEAVPEPATFGLLAGALGAAAAVRLRRRA